MIVRSGCVLSLVLVTSLGCLGNIAGTGEVPGAEGAPTDNSSGQPRRPGTVVPGGNPVGAPSLPGTVPTPAEPQETPTVPPAELACAPDADPAIPGRIWRLSAAQYAATVRAMWKAVVPAATTDPLAGVRAPFEGTNRSDRFSTLARSYSIDEAGFRDALDAASAIGERLAGELQKNGCLADLAGCQNKVLPQAGAVLFRRPLTGDEVAQYVAVGTAERARGEAPAAALALRALMMSAEFLFRVETGAPGTGQMSPHQIAAALSFTLTDGPPDPMLTQAAAAGSLAQPETIRAHVKRLLSAAAERESVRRFFIEYFRFAEVSSVDKDEKSFPFHDPELLRDDTALMVKDLLARSAGKDLLATLLTGTGGFARAKTAPSYGVTLTSKEPTRLDLPGRVGILTQPSWLVAYSQPEHNDPIRRGKFVRETLLCEHLPEIPIGDIPQLPIDEFPTLREALGEHRGQPSCAGCHSLMDPIGFAFEGFDHVGRPRDTEGGKPVDASGEIVGATDPALKGPFRGAAELAERLARASQVTSCFVSHSFQYWLGRAPRQSDGCSLAAATRAYQQSGGDYTELVAALLSSPSFLQRKTATP